MSKEYTNSSAGSVGSAYASLGTYTSKDNGSTQRPSSSIVVLPTFSPPAGYSTLSRGASTSGGYAALSSAYGASGYGSAAQYTSRICQ